MPLERARLRRIWGVRRSTWLLCHLLLCYAAYLVAGASIFSIIESPYEQRTVEHLTAARDAFLARNPCVSDEDLETLIQSVVTASNRGVFAGRNVSSEPNWSFGQSIFFSTTVITTIGYGHVTPLSNGGKIFCIFYAMMGIPLTLMLISALVERLMVPSSHFLQYLKNRYGHLYSMFGIRLIHLFSVGTIIGMAFFLLPAGVFAFIEPEWDYMDSFYYCFISLTTVGLGDYIPGDTPDQSNRPLYKVITTVYLLVGLTFMMMLLTIFYDIPQLNLGYLLMLKSDEVTTDPEKVRLQPSGMVGLLYTQPQNDLLIGNKVETFNPEDIRTVSSRP